MGVPLGQGDKGDASPGRDNSGRPSWPEWQWGPGGTKVTVGAPQDMVTMGTPLPAGVTVGAPQGRVTVETPLPAGVTEAGSSRMVGSGERPSRSGDSGSLLRAGVVSWPVSARSSEWVAGHLRRARCARGRDLGVGWGDARGRRC